MSTRKASKFGWYCRHRNWQPAATRLHWYLSTFLMSKNAPLEAPETANCIFDCFFVSRVTTGSATISDPNNACISGKSLNIIQFAFFDPPQTTGIIFSWPFQRTRYNCFQWWDYDPIWAVEHSKSSLQLLVESGMHLGWVRWAKKSWWQVMPMTHRNVWKTSMFA